jgi:response regulator NasT
MRSVIVAFPEPELARKVHQALLSRGLPVTGMACSGSQVLQQASLLPDGGLIICPFRFADLSANEIQGLLDERFDLLVLVTARQQGSVYGQGLFTLTSPFRPNDIIEAASGLLESRQPTGMAQPTEGVLYQKNRLAAQPADKPAHGRTSTDQQILEQAKAMLMARKHMTEPEAHRFLQKRSMESGIRIVELAKRLLQ